MKVLVLGANGMLGHAMMQVLSESLDYEVHGTIRAVSHLQNFSAQHQACLHVGVDVRDADSLKAILGKIQPDIVINCVGLIKQLKEASDAISAIEINALLPHRVARMCDQIGARMVHFSTDCVFSGSHGMYRESDFSDANDLYGRTKFLGELDSANTVTLRTSIIGHEFGSAHGLVEWFLSQEKSCKGFTRAIFSGLPTVELARVVRDEVIPRSKLSGVLHVAAAPISKYDLLCLIAKVYDKKIKIIPDGALEINRSLNGERFKKMTGYVAPSWTSLVNLMKNSRKVDV